MRLILILVSINMRIILTNHNTRKTALIALMVPMLVAGCTGATTDEAPTGLRIVATTTVLGDLTRQIVGSDADVEVLTPVGVDPHDHQLSARQIADVIEADLVVVNGLGLEEGMEDALESARSDGATLFEVGPLLDPIPFGDHEEDHDDEDHDADASEDSHEHGSDDPHVWLDPVRMAEAARLIAARVAEVAGPESVVAWDERGDETADAITAMHERITQLVSGIPSQDRLLVTNHDALEYFADRYGFQVVGVVIPGGSTMAEPSSSELADLVETILRLDVAAIFADTTDPSPLAAAVADEVGASVSVVELYTGSLGEPGSGAETYIDMMLTNATRIVTALTP